MPAASTSDRRHVPVRCGLAVVAAVALALSLLTPTQPAHAATVPKGWVVLDPDDDYSHAQWGGTTYAELPITYAIAPGREGETRELVRHVGGDQPRRVDRVRGPGAPVGGVSR